MTEVGEKKKTASDDIVIVIVLAITLITPIVLVVWWTVNDILFPPMLVAILFGIAIATLTYRYLGGTERAEFKVGALKLAGSAAMLLGTTTLTNYGLSEHMNSELKPNRISELNKTIATISAQRSSERETSKKEREQFLDIIRKLKVEKIAVEEELNGLRRERLDGVVATVAKFTPDSKEGKEIIRLFMEKEGPFASVKRAFDTKLRVVDKPRSEDAFFACSDLKLAGETVQFSRAVDDSSEPLVLQARYQGRISDIFCSPQTGVRKYSIQIGCEAGKKLLPEQVEGCGQNGAVLWKSDQRDFDMRVEVVSDLQ